MPKTEFQEEQQLILKTKPYLRFRPGDVIYWKTDSARKNPMVIKTLLDITFDEDYVVSWFDSQKCMHTEFMFDCALISGEQQA